MVVARTVIALAVVHALGPSRALPQLTPATRDSVLVVLRMQDHHRGWFGVHAARLAVQEHGPAAGAVALELLESDQTPRPPRGMLLTLLNVAAYERSGFPTDRLMDIVTGRWVVTNSAALNVSIRRRAVSALSSRPRADLEPFWQGLLADPDWSIRQFAVGGLACAEGTGALDTIQEIAVMDTSQIVRRVAAFHADQLAADGDSAKSCLFGTWTRSQALSGELPPDSTLSRTARRLFGYSRERGQ